MARRKSKKTGKDAGKDPRPAPPEPPEATPEPGMPRPESIVGETEFTSPSGAKYRIIHTTEVDPSDEPKASAPRSRRKKR